MSDRQKRLAAAGLAARQEKARLRALKLRPIVEDIQARGFTTLRAIGAELDRRGIPAARGGLWHSESVSELLGRF